MRKSGSVSERGQAFTLVIVFMGFLMIYIGFTSLHLLTETKPIQEKDLASVQAQYSAEAGLEVTRRALLETDLPVPPSPPYAAPTSIPPPAQPVKVYALDWRSPPVTVGQAGTATVQVVARPGGAPYNVTLQSEGTSQDIPAFPYYYGATGAGPRGKARVKAQVFYNPPPSWSYGNINYWNVNLDQNWDYQRYP